MSRYARRLDDNHAHIVNGLRKHGVLVHSTANIGGGFPDLFCGLRGKVALLEIKDPKKPPSARALTEAETEFHRVWFGYPVFVVHTLDEALGALGVGK